MSAPSFEDQATEVELHFLGLRDFVDRATSGKLKRPEHEIEQKRRRMVVAEAAAKTIRHVADRAAARSSGCPA